METFGRGSGNPALATTTADTTRLAAHALALDPRRPMAQLPPPQLRSTLNDSAATGTRQPMTIGVLLYFGILY